MPLQDTQSRKINRTVCIGLGGTGRDVLMKIRRLIVDRYGDFKKLPVVSFVHLDTDKATSSITGLRTGNIYHGVDLRFSDAEKFAATMTRSEVDNFVGEIARREKNHDGTPGVYSNISSWFPPHLLRNLKAIEDGAQAIRPVGRLAFFHNYRKIKAALESAERRTRGHESFMIRNNWSVENKLNIFVVGSLCGGTGSGIFLDVAYCLRQMYGNDGAQIAGYFIISPELYGNAPDKSANTYAALKELNYYATMGTTFKAKYDLQYLESIEETRPPFEYIYLVSNRTARDYRILEKSKLCNIIAHKITLDFVGELAPIVTAQRDNFLQHMIQTDEHPRTNVQRYLTFGLAQIYFPRDAAVSISLNRIKIKLLDFWRQGEGQSADPSNLLASFLDLWYDSNDNINGFVNKLEQSTIDGSKTFNNALSRWRTRLDNSIAEMQNRDERQRIVAQLGREIRSEFRKVQPGETEINRGLWFTSLLKQRDRLTTEYIQNIDQYLAELLNPNNINFSLANARGWLEALTTELNKSYRELDDRISSLGTTNALEAVERRWQETQETIQEIENKRDFPFRDKQKTSQVQEEAKRIVGQVSKLIKENYESALFREALTIVKALQYHVKQLITKASSFSNLLSNVQVVFEKAENDLKLLDVDDMSGEAIFANTDTDSGYEHLFPDRDRRAQLALVSSKITEKVGLGESLASCLDRGVVDEQNLQEQINLVVDGMFGSRSLSSVQSAVKRFLESYSFSDRAVRLEQIIRESEPLLPLNTSDPYFFDDPGKSLSMIGFKDTDKPEIAQFKNIIFRDLGIRDNELKPIQIEDKVILVKEYAAFPLRLIQGIKTMRKHYLYQKEKKSYLHIDYKFEFEDFIDKPNINSGSTSSGASKKIDSLLTSNTTSSLQKPALEKLIEYDLKSKVNMLQSYPSSSTVAIVKVFLASSSELKEEREQFEIFINRKNKQYIKKGVFFYLEIWEDFIDAISLTRLQDEYNKEISNCDIFISLFYTKVGKYTEEEFSQALKAFKTSKKLFVYTYFKNSSININDIKEKEFINLVKFKNRLKEEGHFPTEYTDIASLKLHFGDQIEKILPKIIKFKTSSYEKSLNEDIS